MKKSFSHILQYHNATIIILISLVLILGGYVFAQTETGQEIIGQKQEKVISVDNKALLEADLANFDMNFKILDIWQDNATSTEITGSYYIKYSYRDLYLIDNVWQWLVKEKTLEISKKSVENRDLGEYVAEELSEIAYWRERELKQEQDKAKQIGLTEKKVVSEYSGLIGKVLDIKNAVFPGYQPVFEIAPIAQIAPVGPIQTPEPVSVSEPEPEPEPELELELEPVLVPEPESETASGLGSVSPPIIDNDNATSTDAQLNN